MFVHILSDGGEWSSSLTGLGRTSDINIEIRCWVDHRGGFDAVKRGLVRAGRLNTDFAVVQPLSWSLYRTKCSGNSSADEGNV